MGGESSGSSGERLHLPTGSETELCRISGTHLYLIDGEESVLMQSGDFLFLMVKQSRSPLAAVVAQVGDVQWPIGKDSPVMRVGNRRYTFSLPGLAYGLVLPEATGSENIQRLEALLLQYATYETHPEITAGLKDELPKVQEEVAAAEYWTTVAGEVENTSAKIARQKFGGSLSTGSTIVRGGEMAALSLQKGVCAVKNRSSISGTGAAGSLEVSPRMMKRIQQARRMSAVAKLLSKTLLKGAISAAGHVAKNVAGSMNASASGWPLQSTAAMRDVAVASVDAFAKVVEAVETAGKNLLETAGGVGKELVQDRGGNGARQAAQDCLGATANVEETAWTLNKIGLWMLLRATAASTAINVARASSSESSSHESSSTTLPPSGSTISSSTSRSFSPPPPPFHQPPDTTTSSSVVELASPQPSSCTTTTTSTYYPPFPPVLHPPFPGSSFQQYMRPATATMPQRSSLHSPHASQQQHDQQQPKKSPQ